MPSHIVHYQAGCKRGTYATTVCVPFAQKYTGEDLGTFMRSAYRCPACLKKAEVDARSRDKALML